MALGAAAILGAAWKLQETGTFGGWEDVSGPEDVSLQDYGLQEGETGFRTKLLAGDSGEAYMEVALAYILDLEDYEKSLYYLDKIEEYIPARDLKEIAEALFRGVKEPETP